MNGRLHVVGAGLAGLACAVAAARSGVRVSLYESAAHAGGRCRSFHDDRLGCMVDNGTHLVLGANRTALAFAAAIGGLEAMVAAAPVFPFLDLASGERWSMVAGRLPAGLGETVAALGLPWCPPGETVAVRLGPAPSYRRLWRPLCEAILNTGPAEASALLFARTLRTALIHGAKGMRPYLFPLGLSAAFAAPAVATLAAHGAELNFGRRLTRVEDDALRFDDGCVAVAPDDRVVLALPPWALADVMAGIAVPPTRAIVNAHFRTGPGAQGFLGLVGGTAQWLFARGEVVSATVSNADRLAERPAEEIAATLWADIASALGLSGPIPPYRVLKERRATLAHTPEVVRRRPGPATKNRRVCLAGDWLAGPWPCTIEAAIASGLDAARLTVGRRDLSFA